MTWRKKSRGSQLGNAGGGVWGSALNRLAREDLIDEMDLIRDLRGMKKQAI